MARPSTHPLRRWRLGRSLTQSALAARLGISKNRLSEVERGHMPSLPLAVRIESVTRGLVRCRDLVPKKEQRHA